MSGNIARMPGGNRPSGDLLVRPAGGTIVPSKECTTIDALGLTGAQVTVPGGGRDEVRRLWGTIPEHARGQRWGATFSGSGPAVKLQAALDFPRASFHFRDENDTQLGGGFNLVVGVREVAFPVEPNQGAAVAFTTYSAVIAVVIPPNARTLWLNYRARFLNHDHGQEEIHPAPVMATIDEGYVLRELSGTAEGIPGTLTVPAWHPCAGRIVNGQSRAFILGRYCGRSGKSIKIDLIARFGKGLGQRDRLSLGQVNVSSGAVSETLLVQQRDLGLGECEGPVSWPLVKTIPLIANDVVAYFNWFRIGQINVQGFGNRAAATIEVNSVEFV